MDKLKGFVIKSIVLLINAALVVGGVFFLKNQQKQKQAQVDAAQAAADLANQIEAASQSSDLQKIIDSNRQQKADSVASNTGTITVQKPVTVKETIPGKTTTVTVPASSSTSSSSSAPVPKTTTKKS
ncbi:MAG TPA: hypothetical protein VF817_02860 [Patescibacteria group bacterium]